MTDSAKHYIVQKYRLHTRRPTPTIHNNESGHTPQFLVVGGIWVPAAEYAAVSTTTSSGEVVSAATTNGIYAPVVAAAAPQPLASTVQKPKPKPKIIPSSAAVAAVECNSPTTSSSTHTSSVSPASS